MSASEHFVNTVYGFATKRRAAITNPSFAVCFETYIEKSSDMFGELLVLIIRGIHIHSNKVSQVKKVLSYVKLLDAAAANNMCQYFVDGAFNEMEQFLSNDLLAQTKSESKGE